MKTIRLTTSDTRHALC